MEVSQNSSQKGRKKLPSHQTNEFQVKKISDKLEIMVSHIIPKEGDFFVFQGHQINDFLE